MQTKNEYSKKISAVKTLKIDLSRINKGSKEFQTKSRKYLKLLIETKASSWCLDNEKERVKLNKLLVKNVLSLFS